jgi:hypothetical protein
MLAHIGPRYGGIKGSYVSPYDIGKTPGDSRLPSSSTTVEEFEELYGNRADRASECGLSEDSEASDETVTVAPMRVPVVPVGVSTFHSIETTAQVIINLA